MKHDYKGAWKHDIFNEHALLSDLEVEMKTLAQNLSWSKIFTRDGMSSAYQEESESKNSVFTQGN